MAFSDFWRRDRDRDRDWREGRRGVSSSWPSSWEEPYETREPRDEGFRRRGGWREGSDYYGDNPERYGAGNYDPHGRQDHNRGRSSFNDRWQSSYGGSMPSERYRGSSGYGGGDYGDTERYGRGRSRYQSREDDRSERFGGLGQGQFRGRGPKGYQRSDERIREDVCECLTDDDFIDASNIEVAVKECEVTLTGTVDSRAEKRRAEELIDRLSGVKDVHNQLRVSEGRSVSGERSPQDIHH